MPGSPWWAPIPFIVGSALLLLVRAAHWHLARRYYVASLLWAFFNTPYFSVLTVPWAELISYVLVLPLAGVRNAGLLADLAALAVGRTDGWSAEDAAALHG